MIAGNKSSITEKIHLLLINLWDGREEEEEEEEEGGGDLVSSKAQ